MIDHIGFSVRDIEKSKKFYTEALKPLGYIVIMDFGNKAVGFGADGKPDFWIGKGEVTGKFHNALVSPDRPTVDAFHAAALKAGGKDNGKPGLRLEYHPNYYGAFIFDPDGNNIEAVCHT